MTQTNSTDCQRHRTYSARMKVATAGMTTLRAASTVKDTASSSPDKRLVSTTTTKKCKRIRTEKNVVCTCRIVEISQHRWKIQASHSAAPSVVCTNWSTHHRRMSLGILSPSCEMGTGCPAHRDGTKPEPSSDFPMTWLSITDGEDQSSEANLVPVHGRGRGERNLRLHGR